MLRLAVPDFEAVARLYLSKGNDVVLDTFASMVFGKWRVAHDGEVLYHRTTYDRASLAALLARSGFERAAPWNWQLVDHGRFDDYSQAYHPHMAKNTYVPPPPAHAGVFPPFFLPAAPTTRACVGSVRSGARPCP